ncbi:hypothetical protein EBR57_02490 [bacterium]|nr:hypothetical protein [bacterium]
MRHLPYSVRCQFYSTNHVHFCAKKGLAVERYYDRAVGVLAKNESGKLAITQIALSPQVTFSGERQPDPAELQGLHESAHRNCFIANSINATVIIG